MKIIFCVSKIAFENEKGKLRFGIFVLVVRRICLWPSGASLLKYSMTILGCLWFLQKGTDYHSTFGLTSKNEGNLAIYVHAWLIKKMGRMVLGFAGLEKTGRFCLSTCS
ncbi:MAG: hypothetical protein EA394_00700 [Bacteroidia bacterium]|nr:MAG: hypothetical protein EA394_00700 [Bacteroidia bacterium]